MKVRWSVDIVPECFPTCLENTMGSIVRIECGGSSVFATIRSLVSKMDAARLLSLPISIDEKLERMGLLVSDGLKRKLRRPYR